MMGHRAPGGATTGLAMDALVLTVGVFGLMALALILLGRTWPRSSRVVGYRAGRGAGHADGGAGSGAGAGTAEPGAPEDDDARWSWPDDDPGRDIGA
jgi:hypothetical protein